MATKPDNEFLTDTSRPSNHNYLAANYFRLAISRAPTVAYFAQEVAFPSINLREIAIPTTLSTMLQTPGNQYEFLPLTVKFLVDENLRGWKEVYNWISTIANYKTETEVKHKDKFSDITLTVTNSAYKGKYEVIFRNAFPISISEIPFSVTATTNVPMTATVAFKYIYYDFKDLTEC